MSSEAPADVPSPGPDSEGAPDLAGLLRSRGAPLIEALEAHLPGSREHAEATAAYAFASAVELGFERVRCASVREAAMLHEIGQVYVPASVLAKRPAARDAGEQQIFDTHYEAGYRLGRGSGIPEQVCGWLLRARERFDGSGPEGLSGDSIPVEARICRAACECAGHLSDADSGIPAPELAAQAMSALRADAGGELDPQIVAVLTAVLELSAEPSSPN